MDQGDEPRSVLIDQNPGGGGNTLARFCTLPFAFIEALCRTTSQNWHWSYWLPPKPRLHWLKRRHPRRRAAASFNAVPPAIVWTPMPPTALAPICAGWSGGRQQACRAIIIPQRLRPRNSPGLRRNWTNGSKAPARLCRAQICRSQVYRTRVSVEPLLLI